MMPLVSGLCAIIPGGISVEDYAIATSTDHVSAKSMLLDLVENQIGVQEKQSFEFNDGDRLRAAILCLQRGATVDDVASNLNWKDFEGLWHLRYWMLYNTQMKNYVWNKDGCGHAIASTGREHQFMRTKHLHVLSSLIIVIMVIKCHDLAKTARDATFEFLSIMGSKIFTHSIRMAVSNSLKLTAIHASASLVLFITSFFL